MTIEQARAKLGDLVIKAMAGQSTVITRYGKPVAQIAPFKEPGPAMIDCLPGQQTKPTDCNRHADHYWCKTCEGFYGVPHTGMHEPGSRHGNDLHMAQQCACRPCQQLAAQHTEEPTNAADR